MKDINSNRIDFIISRITKLQQQAKTEEVFIDVIEEEIEILQDELACLQTKTDIRKLYDKEHNTTRMIYRIIRESKGITYSNILKEITDTHKLAYYTQAEIKDALKKLYKLEYICVKKELHKDYVRKHNCYSAEIKTVETLVYYAIK